MSATDRLLARRHAEVGRRVAATSAAKVELLEAVKQARAEGYSIQRIADALELSKSRAQQLVRQADGRGRSSR